MDERQEAVVNKPSPETMRRVYQFFMRTSIPRILAEERAKKGEKENTQRSHQENCAIS